MAEYGVTDRLTGGTPSADSVNAGYVAANACDNNATTYWQSALAACPHWWKYDFGAGVTWKISKVTIKGYGSSLSINAFKVQGSNNDSNWDDLHSDNCANNSDVQTFTFTNRTPYRYFRIYISSSYDAGGSVAEYEFEAFEGIYKDAAFLLNMMR